VAVYTVSQVTGYLRESLESDPILSDLYVVGEVSNLRVSSAGHSYFTLKDAQSVLNCVMFRGQTGADLLANGGSVSTHGHLSFYEPRGSTDFMVDLAMTEGVGELALELERLRVRLEAEGLFDPSRKRPLPQFPKVVGVVTSLAGAVFHDIQNVISRRFPMIELLLAPTAVQGADAAPGIVAAIEGLNRDGRADVIIIARGGGSLEDVWAFNEEVVSRAIYASRIPVVSAVGHETDVTISDYVADVRAPTPSAAAELVVPDALVIRQELAGLMDGLRLAIAYQLDYHRDELAGMVRRLDAGLPDLETSRRRVDDLGRSIHRQLNYRLGLTKLEVSGLEDRLGSLSPMATLRRGFSVVQRTATQEVVTGKKGVSNGDALTLTVVDGTIDAIAGTESVSKRRAPRKHQQKITPTHSMDRLL